MCERTSHEVCACPGMPVQPAIAFMRRGLVLSAVAFVAVLESR